MIQGRINSYSYTNKIRIRPFLPNTRSYQYEVVWIRGRIGTPALNTSFGRFYRRQVPDLGFIFIIFSFSNIQYLGGIRPEIFRDFRFSTFEGDFSNIGSAFLRFTASFHFLFITISFGDGYDLITNKPSKLMIITRINWDKILIMLFFTVSD